MKQINRKGAAQTKVWKGICCVVLGMMMTGCKKTQTPTVAEKNVISTAKITEKELNAMDDSLQDEGYGYQGYQFTIPSNTKEITVAAYHIDESGAWQQQETLVVDASSLAAKEGKLVIVNGEKHALTLAVHVDGKTFLQQVKENPLTQMAAGSFLFVEGEEEIVLEKEIPIYLERYYPSHIAPLKDLSNFFDAAQYAQDYVTIGVTIQFTAE